MNSLVLPFTSTPQNYTVDVDLDNQQYTFELQYNNRDDAWFFDLRDANNEIVVAGVRLIVRQSLLNNLIMPNRPPGMLLALDSENKDKDPGINDLGTRVKVLYIPLAELQNAGFV